MSENNFSKMTQYEKENILPVVREELKWRIGANNCISNPDLVKFLQIKGFKKATEVTVKLCIFHLRNYENFDLLIANTNGHFISNDIEEVRIWMKMQRSKIAAMNFTLKNMEEQLDKNVKALRKGKALNLGGQLTIFDALHDKPVKFKKKKAKKKVKINIEPCL